MPRPHTRVSMIELDFVALRIATDYIREHCQNGSALLVTEMSFFENGSVEIAGINYADNPTANVRVYAQANGYIERDGVVVKTAPVVVTMSEEEYAALPDVTTYES